MYHEFRDTKRTGWAFTYQGQELAPYAERKLVTYAGVERSMRSIVASLMLDKTVAASDKRIEDARKAVETNGAIHEQLLVWVHEFKRNPDREYHLSLGDVVFFGIVELAE